MKKLEKDLVSFEMHSKTLTFIYKKKKSNSIKKTVNMFKMKTTSLNIFTKFKYIYGTFISAFGSNFSSYSFIQIQYC